MAEAVKKQRGGDRGNPVIKAVEGEVLAPAKSLGTTYREIVNRRGVGGRPSHIRTEEELIEGIVDYLNGLMDKEGKYVGAPSLRGLGAFLGYNTSSWYTTVPFQDAINHFKLWVDGWRMDKVAAPRGGINPAGIMFLLSNSLDKDELTENMNNVTPLIDDDTRPTDAATLIDDVWSKKGEQ